MFHIASNHDFQWKGLEHEFTARVQTSAFKIPPFIVHWVFYIALSSMLALPWRNWIQSINQLQRLGENWPKIFPALACDFLFHLKIVIFCENCWIHCVCQVANEWDRLENFQISGPKILSSLSNSFESLEIHKIIFTHFRCFT